MSNEPKFIAKSRKIGSSPSESYVIPKLFNKNKSIKDRLAELKPIDNLEIENFAKDLAANKTDPQKYSTIIGGFFERRKLDRQNKSVQLFNTYLQNLRTASDSAEQLQETILKNRIIFIFQVEFAQERLKQQWALEKKGYEYQLEIMETNIEKQKFFRKFYKNTEPSSLSETALMLLTMTTERYSSSSILTPDYQNTKTVQYGSPEDIVKVKQFEKYFEIYMQQMANEIRKGKAEAEQSENKSRLQKFNVDEEIKEKKRE